LRAEEVNAAAGPPAVLLVQLGLAEREDDRAVDRLLDLLEAADVVERRRLAPLDLDRRCSRIRRRPRDADDGLDAELLVDLALEGGDALDDTCLAGAVREPRGQNDVAGGESGPASFEQSLVAQVTL